MRVCHASASIRLILPSWGDSTASVNHFVVIVVVPFYSSPIFLTHLSKNSGLIWWNCFHVLPFYQKKWVLEEVTLIGSNKSSFPLEMCSVNIGVWYRREAVIGYPPRQSVPVPSLTLSLMKQFPLRPCSRPPALSSAQVPLPSWLLFAHIRVIWGGGGFPFLRGEWNLTTFEEGVSTDSSGLYLVRCFVVYHKFMGITKDHPWLHHTRWLADQVSFSPENTRTFSKKLKRL